MSTSVHRRIEGCLLDWVVPQKDVDAWEAKKQAYAKAGRASEGPKGPWTGMKAKSPAPWDETITLCWEIDLYDESRRMTGLSLTAVAPNGVRSGSRSLGFFASLAEARLFAASLALGSEVLTLNDRLEAGGFKHKCTHDGGITRWARSFKSGALEIVIEPERTVDDRCVDPAFHLVYEGRSALRSLTIVRSCAAWDHSFANDPDRTPHPTAETEEDAFSADLAAALTVVEARLVVGNIRKPLEDGQEVPFIQELIARRDAAQEERAGNCGIRP